MQPFDAFQQKPFPRRRSWIEYVADTIGLNRFFLREGKRPFIQTEKNILVSPAECKLEEIQSLRPSEEIHGKTTPIHTEHYTFCQIVHDTPQQELFSEGLCFNLYLSPLNLHYLLFPTDLSVQRLDHHPAFSCPILFMKSGEIHNERLVIYAEAFNQVPVVIVLVGSFLVNGIECIAEVGGGYSRGELMGGFKLGSTVMVLFPKNTVEPVARVGEKLCLGEPMARFL